VIPLANARVLVYPEHVYGKPFCFGVTPHRSFRSFVFCASSEDELRSWVSALRQAIAAATPILASVTQPAPATAAVAAPASPRMALASIGALPSDHSRRASSGGDHHGHDHDDDQGENQLSLLLNKPWLPGAEPDEQHPSQALPNSILAPSPAPSPSPQHKVPASAASSSNGSDLPLQSSMLKLTALSPPSGSASPRRLAAAAPHHPKHPTVVSILQELALLPPCFRFVITTCHGLAKSASGLLQPHVPAGALAQAQAQAQGQGPAALKPESAPAAVDVTATPPTGPVGAVLPPVRYARAPVSGPKTRVPDLCILHFNDVYHIQVSMCSCASAAVVLNVIERETDELTCALWWCW